MAHLDQRRDRSSWAMRLVGVLGLVFTGSIFAVVLTLGFFAAIIGFLVVVTSPSLWASLLGG